MKTTIQVFIFKKINDNYKYLLLKRISSRGGFWQPVTGRTEKGESLIKAAKREVKEETGIENIKRIIKRVHQYIHEENPKIKEFVFGAEVDPKTEILFDINIYPEHDNVKWCSYTEALRLLKWPQNKEALKKLNKLLKKS